MFHLRKSVIIRISDLTTSDKIKWAGKLWSPWGATYINTPVSSFIQMLSVVLLFLNVLNFVVEMNLQLDQFEHAASLPPLSHYHNIDSRLLIFVPVSTVSSLTYFYLPILAHYIHPALVALSLPDMNRSCCLYLSACLFFYGNLIIFAFITNKKKRVYINIESTECNNLCIYANYNSFHAKCTV